MIRIVDEGGDERGVLEVSASEKVRAVAARGQAGKLDLDGRGRGGKRGQDQRGKRKSKCREYLCLSHGPIPLFMDRSIGCLLWYSVTSPSVDHQREIMRLPT